MRLLLIVFLFSATLAQAQFASKITCFFPKAWNGKQAILVSSPLGRKQGIDTATIDNRSATFIVKLAEPCPAYVWVEGNKEDITLFLDSPQIAVAYDPEAAVQTVISGSPESELWRQEKNKASERNEFATELYRQAYEAFSASDSLTGLRYRRMIDSLQVVIEKMLVQQIENNPTSGLSWYKFSDSYNRFPYKQAWSLFIKLSTFSNYPTYKSIQQVLLQRQPGKKAPDFSLISLTNDTITLSKLESRLILIDFASLTLHTCQERHSALRKLYETYHSLGLDIITICFEPDRQTWQANRVRDCLPWRQAFSLLKPSDPVIDAFAVKRMPDNVLLGADKTVLERDLSVSELDAKLKQLLNKP
ncbi:DUF4369 domain-containing protein [Spirosoma fluminis]